ncbi:MAG: extracellular metalloprotease M10 family [Parcubacteria bacterium C7867-005]|nr:MAG: extracellular metalloprotease M10 family [Parcubacteria bacterium C7867-005]
MFFVRKNIWWIVLLLLASGAYVLRPEPCTEPISYQIGKFDPKFGISEETFLKVIEEASLVWEKSINKDLFVYDSEGEIVVNLIYDERQATSDKNQELESHVEESKQTAEEVKAKFLALEDEYQEADEEYKQMLESFQKDHDQYNAEVEYYNQRGGAPKNEYDRLVREKARLAVMNKEMESKRLEVNALAEEVNSFVAEYNDIIRNVNSKINTINESAGKEFSEGEYVRDRDGRRINIYEFDSLAKLRRVLAHEFGHALDLEHNPNPDSIMYYLNNSLNMAPTTEEKGDLAKVCKLS